MNAPPTPATRPSSPVEPQPADEEQGLTTLLELFSAEDPAELTTSARRSGGARLRAAARERVRRLSARVGSGVR